MRKYCRRTCGTRWVSGLAEKAGKSRLPLTRLLRRDIEEKITQIEDGESCRTFIENTRTKLREKDESGNSKSQDQATNKEIEDLKQQLSNREENHQKQEAALQ